MNTQRLRVGEQIRADLLQFARAVTDQQYTVFFLHGPGFGAASAFRSLRSKHSARRRKQAAARGNMTRKVHVPRNVLFKTSMTTAAKQRLLSLGTKC